MVAEATKNPAPAVRIKQIALPTEHGGWGFLFEPLVAGLVIAFSPAGFWIALMTVGAFLTRQPLKVLVVDRLGMKVDARAKAAFLLCLAFGSIVAVGFAGAALTAGLMPLLPFAIAIPLALIQLYYDFSRQSRHLLPELGGGVTISACIASIALAGGLGWPAALGLWAIFVARLIPSILYVRERLLLEKGKPFSRTAPVGTHVAAVLLVAVLAFYGVAPKLPVLVMLLLLYRCVEGLSDGRRKMKAVQIGIREVIYGTIIVISVILGHYLGF